MTAEPCVIDMARAGERYLIDLRSPEGLRVAAYLLRDVEYGNLVGTPEFDLLRLAAWAQAWMAAYGRYTVLDVHSGLRTREHNSRLEKAKINSLHIPRIGNRFSAMDVDPYGIDRDYFGQLVATTKFGGVGWYSTHIHFDCRAHPAYWRA
jgi:uncharacterized protein YcbK (DUF882 family)